MGFACYHGIAAEVSFAGFLDLVVGMIFGDLLGFDAEMSIAVAGFPDFDVERNLSCFHCFLVGNRLACLLGLVAQMSFASLNLRSRRRS